MVYALDVSAGPADRILFLTGPPPEVGTVLELRSDIAWEVVLVECEAGSQSVQVQRAYRGKSGQWPCGTWLREPVEFVALADGWWECWPCGVPVTPLGRGRHAAWRENMPSQTGAIYGP